MSSPHLDQALGRASIPSSHALTATLHSYADPNTSAPLYVCAALFAVCALVSIVFPFEPLGRRSS